MGTEHQKLKRYRKQAFAKQDGKCFWCGQRMIEKTPENAKDAWDHPRCCTADHVKPRAEGGQTTPQNIVAACRACNNGRHYVPTVWSAGEGRATLADVWPKGEQDEGVQAQVERTHLAPP